MSRGGFVRRPFAQTFDENSAWRISTSQLHVERRCSVSEDYRGQTFGTPSWTRHRPEECRTTSTAVLRPPLSRTYLVDSGRLRGSLCRLLLLCIGLWCGFFLKYLDERILNFVGRPWPPHGGRGEWQWRWPGFTWVSAARPFRPSPCMLYSVGSLSALPVKRSSS